MRREMSDSSRNNDAKNEALSQSRRDFLNKYAKLAVVTPIAMSTLMSPSTSAAPKSCRGNGAKKCT